MEHAGVRFRLATCAEAARLLGVSRAGMRWLVRRRRVRVVRTVGGRVLIPVRELERLAAARRARPRGRRGGAGRE